MKSKIAVSFGLAISFVAGLLAYHPVAQAVEARKITHCTGIGACAGGVNASTGAGQVGGSNGGNGVVGWTTAVATSTAAPIAGVYGADLSTSGLYDAGVFGKSVRGLGVLGTSVSNDGIFGETSAPGTGSSTFSGVFGQDLSTSGPEYNAGVTGATTNGYGVAGRASGVYGVAVYGRESNGEAGNGVTAESDSSEGGAALAVYSPNGAALVAASGQAYSLFLVDQNANIDITGEIYTDGKCVEGCLRHRHVRSYGMTAALPTLEDNGEAQLAGGAASVRLDSAFANAIDPQLGYIVQLTPEGDTRGLYVASRSPREFVVRETMGGRGNIAFAYRIVAHPYGVRAARLPFEEARTDLIVKR